MALGAHAAVRSAACQHHPRWSVGHRKFSCAPPHFVSICNKSQSRVHTPRDLAQCAYCHPVVV